MYPAKPDNDVLGPVLMRVGLRIVAEDANSRLKEIFREELKAEIEAERKVLGLGPDEGKK